MTRRIVLLAAAATLSTLAVASAGETVPVVLGGDGRHDACMSQGMVVGLDPGGDGFLSVRSGPGGRGYAETDRLYNGDTIWICGYRTMPWYPVVYDRRGRRDCLARVTNGIPTIYRGPCKAGWIHSRYVRITAG